MRKGWFALLALAATAAIAQPQGGPPEGGPPRHGPGGPPPNGPRGGPPPGGPNGPGGRWWTDPRQVERLGLTADQQKRIDAEFQQSRLKLIDLTAAVEKEEAILEPLLAADQPDEKRVLAQIDKIAQARAELEKANARMLLGFRGVLSAEQWKKLQAEEAPSRGGPPRGGGPPPQH